MTALHRLPIAIPRRDDQTASARVAWLSVVALLVLPGCDKIFSPGSEPSDNVHPGPHNHISAIFCDIERMSEPRYCPSLDPATGLPIIPAGILLSQTAVALTMRQTSNIGLDDSPEALARCGGHPEVVTYEAAFPEGYPVCVNCISAIGGTYPDANAVCLAQCEDLNGGNAHYNSPELVEYCQAHAHVSTNAPVDDCFVGACTPAGMLRPDFLDPRRVPEPVVWQNLLGVTPSFTQDPFGEGISSLTRTSPTSDPPANPPFDAGAASSQRITRGDGYVEFSASENNLSHACGLSHVDADGPLGCAFEHCDDHDPSLADVDFSVSLNADGRFYIIESGVLVPGPDVNGSFGTYAAGERFRVRVKDNNDFAHSATIFYSRVSASCFGAACPETVLPRAATSRYPLRADTSFREQGATLTGVRLLRIK